MTDREEFIQIITDHPELFELAMLLVVEQAQIYGIQAEAGHRSK